MNLGNIGFDINTEAEIKIGNATVVKIVLMCAMIFLSFYLIRTLAK